MLIIFSTNYVPVDMLSLKCNFDKLFHAASCCGRNFSRSSWLSLTHYDVLNLKRNCTQKEIREAYIKLCKETHPDRDKKDETLHQKFLHISEAYKVLSKPDSRRMYDASIAYLDERRRQKSVMFDDHDTEDFHRVWKHPAFYHNRKEEFMKSKPIPDDMYYGIKGIKRISNGTMFVILLAFSLISGFIQIIAIKNSVMSNERQRLAEENAKLFQSIRDKNDALTEDESLEELERAYYENLSNQYPKYREQLDKQKNS